MGDEDQEFKGLLERFKRKHEKQTRNLEAHMNKCKKILEEMENVRRTPISARLKDKNEALITLERRQEDRKELQRLKVQVESRRSESWVNYCKAWNMEDKATEAEPFTKVTQMFEAMHDLVGIRISLYFPDDVQTVIDFLRERFDIVKEPSRKGGLDRDYQKIQKLVEHQLQILNTTENEHGDFERVRTTGSAPEPPFESPFEGYRATRVVIRHKDKFDQHADGNHIINMEVQIGSIIMHAWSDIEHDILYKPSEMGGTSPDLIRMRSLINGIVITSEVALQQLAVFTAQSTRQAEDRAQKALGWEYMTPWLNKYFQDRNEEPRTQWMSTRFLFEILKTTDEHTYGRLEELLNEMKPQPKPEEHLPIMILQHLGRNPDPFRDLPFPVPETAAAWNARYWASCLVNTMNLATFMGIGLIVLREMEKETKLSGRPRFAEFLDILHPTKLLRRQSREAKIISFCKKLLNIKLETRHGLAAMKLASAGYVARPLIPEEEREFPASNKPPPIFIPADLQRLTQDNVTTFHLTLSALNEDLRRDEHLYFIPRRPYGSNCAWKPVIRKSGCDWIITRTPFAEDKSLELSNDKLNQKAFTGHLCRVLDVKIKPDEIIGLRKLAEDLKMVDENKLRLIVKLNRILGNLTTDKINQFIALSKALNVKEDKDIDELAKLVYAVDTMDKEEIKLYRELSDSKRGIDVEELRAYKWLILDNKTHDPAKLRELRDKQKNAERKKT